MRCSQPFMRTHTGKIRSIANLTEDERLGLTPFPCGWCLPCRINKARMWQHRIMLECKSHAENSFVTLTYQDDNLPMNDHGEAILIKEDLQKYVKRLRKRIGNEHIRYFGVGEYGSKTERPHYHICLFGVGSADAPSIELAWSVRRKPIGFVHVGTVTPDSARYIAGYTIKKLTRPTDERLCGRPPEFMLSSRRNGGIGLSEVLRIAGELRKNDFFDLDRVINTFQIGGRTFPLGGYLTSKLFDALGIDEQVKKEALIEYQNKLFMDNDVHTENYYQNIVDGSANYRKRLQLRETINKKEKQL